MRRVGRRWPLRVLRWGIVAGTLLLPNAGVARAAAQSRVTLLFFWGVGCPHCEEAKPFVARLPREYPRLDVESIEIRRDPNGRARFIETMERLRAQGVGIPTFVVGERYVVGFAKGDTEPRVRALIEHALRGEGARGRLPDEEQVIRLPLFGDVDPQAMPLPAFAAVVGLIDGVNPCAIWVLVVLLGILSHVRSTKRLALVAGTFVFVSGVVYFIFMTAWLSVFRFVGLSQTITIALGAALVLMGLVNLKELLWFKKGLSLTIPDRVKPGLYRRMRAIANAVSLPAALAGVVGLAFFVNLIELACTLGLPAAFTRILSLQEQLSSLDRYALLVLYNGAYIIPLAVVVLLYALTLHRMALSERGAKVLKGVSGTLLVLFGLCS